MNAEAGRPWPDPIAPVSRGTAPAAAARPSVALRALPVGVVALGAGLAAILGGGASAAAEPELATLLRFMAGLKAATALAALAAMLWRLGAPPPPRPAALAGWLVALGAMGAGPVLIWQVGPVAMGAIAFHGGLALLVVTLAVLDRDGVAAALSARLGRRRRPTGQVL